MEAYQPSFEYKQLGLAFQVQQSPKRVRISDIEIVAGNKAESSLPIEQVLQMGTQQAHAALHDERYGHVDRCCLVNMRQ